jgi:hypothetical protein
VTLTAFAVLCSLRLEDGRQWIAAASDFQIAAAKAFLSGDRRRHFWLRPRGASKTSDAAALLLALLVAEAPARARLYCFAVDSDQADLIRDAIAGFVSRTPGLPVKVDASKVTATNGATVTVMSSDAASSWGLRPWLLVLDEVAQWPETGKHRKLYSAAMSALPKVKDSRALLITTPGDPTHFSFKRWETAESSPHWWTQHVPGPTPWWSENDVEAARADLLPAEFRQLVLCEWATSDDQLIERDDVLACLSHPGPLEPRRGVFYVGALDIGVKRDPTVFTVGHVEGGRVVIDRVERWVPQPFRPVDLQVVEDRVVELARAFNGAPVIFDPSQAHLLTQRLRSESGLKTEEFPFTGPSTNRLARALYAAIRDRALALPDDEVVVDELSTITLMQTGPGSIKIDHKSGKHNDIAVTVAMVIDRLTGNADRVAFEARKREALKLPPSIMGTGDHGEVTWSGGAVARPKVSVQCSAGVHQKCKGGDCECRPCHGKNDKYAGLAPLFG